MKNIKLESLCSHYHHKSNFRTYYSAMLFVSFPLIVYIGGVHSFKNHEIQIDTLSESVKGMLDEGFSRQEVINTIKLELGITRVKSLIGKLYDGEQLTEEEILKMKSGDVDDNGKDLLDILGKFGMSVMVTQRNATSDIPTSHGVGAPLQSTTDRNREDDYSNRSESVDDDHDEDVETIAAGFIEQQLEGIKQLPKLDYAFSPYNLIRLAKVEETIYKPLRKYIKKMEARLKILKEYTKDFEESSLLVGGSLTELSKAEERAHEIVSNPLTSFRMIRRFAFRLPDVWTSVAEDLEEELWEDLSTVQIEQQPPNEKDWKDAMETLFRIQYYNGYNAKQMSKGTLGSIKSEVKLTAEECMEIGMRAVALKYYDFAMEWLYLAKKKHLGKEDHSEVDLDFLEQSLAFAMKEHNNAWDREPKFTQGSHIYTKKLIDQNYIEVAHKHASVLRDLAKEYRNKEEYGFHHTYNFVSLCAGENLQTVQEKNRLYCWLERSKHPYFYINPMKIELLSDEPYLIQIYDVIGDNLISDVKNRSISRLERSQVVNYDDPDLNDVSLVRTSSQTWIPPAVVRHNKGYLSLTKLIEKLTGLITRKIGSSEDLQVACYGTSHHYDEHLDAVQDPRRTEEYGDRVATFMLYLSDVDQGGLTGFPVIGTAAKPIKGSAVFWYNLKKNGEPDKRTWHGGCPVVHGVKWVMNMWILLYENFHNRPCGLKKTD